MASPPRRLTLPPDGRPSRGTSDLPLELVVTRHGTKVSSHHHPSDGLKRSSNDHLRFEHDSRTVKSPLPTWLQRASEAPTAMAFQSAYIHPTGSQMSSKRHYPAFSRPIPHRPLRHQLRHPRPLASITSSGSQVGARVFSQQPASTSFARNLSPGLPRYPTSSYDYPRQQLPSTWASSARPVPTDLARTGLRSYEYPSSPQTSPSTQAWLEKEPGRRLTFPPDPHYFSTAPQAVEHGRIQSHESIFPEYHVRSPVWTNQRSARSPFEEDSRSEPQQASRLPFLGLSSPAWIGNEAPPDRYLHRLAMAARDVSSSEVYGSLPLSPSPAVDRSPENWCSSSPGWSGGGLKSPVFSYRTPSIVSSTLPNPYVQPRRPQDIYQRSSTPSYGNEERELPSNADSSYQDNPSFPPHNSASLGYYLQPDKRKRLSESGSHAQLYQRVKSPGNNALLSNSPGPTHSWIHQTLPHFNNREVTRSLDRFSSPSPAIREDVLSPSHNRSQAWTDQNSPYSDRGKVTGNRSLARGLLEEEELEVIAELRALTGHSAPTEDEELSGSQFSCSESLNLSMIGELLDDQEQGQSVDHPDVSVGFWSDYQHQEGESEGQEEGAANHGEGSSQQLERSVRLGFFSTDHEDREQSGPDFAIWHDPEPDLS